MLTRLHITILVLLSALIWGLVLWLLGIQVTWDYIKPFAIAVSVLTVVVLVFERYAWKWWIFKNWLVQRPNIEGTWDVELESSYVDPSTQERIPPIRCAMAVRQTYSTLSLRLLTRESSSVLIAHNLILQNDRTFEIAGVYRNTPEVHLRGDRSEIHYGALLLELKGHPVTGLSGHYWTDRGTRGSLKLTNRKLKMVSDYAEAARLYKF